MSSFDSYPEYGLPAPMPPVRSDELRPPRPVTTTVASWCWLVGAALVVIGLPALLYTGVDELADDLLRDSVAANDPMTAGEAELSARLTPIAFVLGFAVLSVPYVVAAVKLRSGRAWSRVLLTVLGLLAGLFGLLVLLEFTLDVMPYVHWGVGMAWSLVFLGVCGLGIVTMYLPASNAYVRSVTR